VLWVAGCGCCRANDASDHASTHKRRRPVIERLDCPASTGSEAVDNPAGDFSRRERSVIVMATSTAEGLTFDAERWGGGAFTKAVVKGLRGKAESSRPALDDLISTEELAWYIQSRVSQLTDGRQTPISSKPAIPPFALTRVPDEGSP